jgi:hypothetical protein
MTSTERSQLARHNWIVRKAKARDQGLSFTQWAIKYPWHVSGEQAGKYPLNADGNCSCQCQWCLADGTHNHIK